MNDAPETKMEKAGDTTASNVTNASSPSGVTVAIVAANVAQLHGEIDQLRMDLKLVIDLNNEKMTERLIEMDASLFRRVCEARDRRFALNEEQEERNRKRIGILETIVNKRKTANEDRLLKFDQDLDEHDKRLDLHADEIRDLEGEGECEHECVTDLITEIQHAHTAICGNAAMIGKLLELHPELKIHYKGHNRDRLVSADEIAKTLTDALSELGVSVERVEVCQDTAEDISVA